MLSLMSAEMRLAAEQAEAEEQAQAAAEGQDPSPAGPSGHPQQPSGRPDDAPRQQPEHAGQGQKGLQPHAPQPGGLTVQKSVKDPGSRSTRARFAETAPVADAAEEERVGSGNKAEVVYYHSPVRRYWYHCQCDHSVSVMHSP